MRHFGIFLLAANLLAPLTAVAVPPARPNVFFILADDLGWVDTTPYGSKFHETPNIHRLAQRSVRFSQYYAASPLCSPTRSSILTGLYPARTGITAPVCHLPQEQLVKQLSKGAANQRVLNADSVTRLKSEYVTLAEVFKQAGYTTAHFGKWHLGHGPGYEPKDQGFDVDVPHTPRAAGPGGGYLAPWKFISDPQHKGQAGEHIDEWMAAQAAKFIQEQRGKPFYLNFWLYSVHSPWNAKPQLIDKFKGTADPNAGQRNPLYAAMVKSMDDAVGKLFDALDASGETQNTIVVFTSDNGGWAYPPRSTDPAGYQETPATSNAPLRSGKASNYEGGTRVPCLIAWPGKAKPAVSDFLFSSVDFFPTLLEMAGVKPKSLPDVDGVNQVPAILGEKPCRDTILVHFPHGSEAQERSIPGFWPATWIRKDQWKLIRFYARNDDRTDRLELYDLGRDAGETTNLAASKPEVVKELAPLMDRFLDETNAVVPRPNANYAGTADAGSVLGWLPSKDAKLQHREGNLILSSTGRDPYLLTHDLAQGKGPFVVELKMNSRSSGPGQVFWRTNADLVFHRSRSVNFVPRHDGDWQVYEVKLDVKDDLAGLRIDPATGPGEVQFEWIRLKGSGGRLLKTWSFRTGDKQP